MTAARFVAAVWLIHGLYNKLLGGSPRHLAIVQSVPGLEGHRGVVGLTAVGVFEVAVAIWVLSGVAPRTCAAAQSAALLSMNAVELSFARPLLLWPAGLLPLNLMFLAIAWTAAGWRGPARLAARLRRHPFPIVAHFDRAVTLVYALPAERLRPPLPPGVELETVNGEGFVAVALVATRRLRPAGLPAVAGNDFFLAGYRIFTRFRTGDGRTLRGLYILRSDTDRALMVGAGNLFTRYDYRPCAAHITTSPEAIAISVTTADGTGDLDLTVDPRAHTLPSGSPFNTVREARRFAGPLPFTFSYEPDTRSMVVIRATRASWTPEPVAASVARIGFFGQPCFQGSQPRLAAAFQVSDIDYRWERGVRHAL